MGSLLLNQSASGVFDASGQAVARLGPSRYSERWHVNNTAISTSSSSVTACKVYRQQITPSALIDISNYNGNGDASDSIYDLAEMEQIIAVWTGGTPGRIATITLSGSIENRR